SQKYPTDYYLDYTFKETTRQLQATIKGHYLPKDTEALVGVLAKLSDKDLMEVSDIEPVLVERLNRTGTEINARNAALEKLSVMHKTDRISEAVAALRRLDEKSGAVTAVKDLANLLSVTPAADLSRERTTLTELA